MNYECLPASLHSPPLPPQGGGLGGWGEGDVLLNPQNALEGGNYKKNR